MKPWAAIVIVLAVAASCGDGVDSIDWLRMKVQEKAKPFGDTPYFANGQVMQPPPEGTVPRERVVGPSTPPTPTFALLARGRERFDIFCAACHGVLGDSDTEVARNMRLRPPPSLHDAERRSYDAPRIHDIASRGYGLMPAYDTVLSDADRWAVAFYVKALQLSQSVAYDTLPADLQTEARGQLGGAP